MNTLRWWVTIDQWCQNLLQWSSTWKFLLYWDYTAHDLIYCFSVVPTKGFKGNTFEIRCYRHFVANFYRSQRAIQQFWWCQNLSEERGGWCLNLMRKRKKLNPAQVLRSRWIRQNRNPNHQHPLLLRTDPLLTPQLGDLLYSPHPLYRYTISE